MFYCTRVCIRIASPVIKRYDMHTNHWKRTIYTCAHTCAKFFHLYTNLHIHNTWRTLSVAHTISEHDNFLCRVKMSHRRPAPNGFLLLRGTIKWGTCSFWLSTHCWNCWGEENVEAVSKTFTDAVHLLTLYTSYIHLTLYEFAEALHTFNLARGNKKLHFMSLINAIALAWALRFLLTR